MPTASITPERSPLAQLSADVWDAAVLDIRMPGMDGIQLLEILRSNPRWQNLPVIFVTAEALGQFAQARELGVKHIFQKTRYDLSELRKARAGLTENPATHPVS